MSIESKALALGKVNELFKSSMDRTAAGTGYLAEGKANPGVMEMIGSFIKIGLEVLGMVFLFLMIYGGVKWMMARDNDQEVTKAKSIIRNTVIGLIIVMAAYAITAFVGNAVKLE